jgi:hypothetical protein
MTQVRNDEIRNGTRDGRDFVAAGSTEARPGLLTTEMWMAWIGAIVLVVAAYVSDTFDNDLGWILAASLFGAYILSRGFAKSGSREGPFFVSGTDRQNTSR